VNEQQEKIAYNLGRLFGALIYISFVVVVTPWIGLGAINRLFETGVAHTPENYLYFWVVIFVIKSGFPRSRL